MYWYTNGILPPKVECVDTNPRPNVHTNTNRLVRSLPATEIYTPASQRRYRIHASASFPRTFNSRCTLSCATQAPYYASPRAILRPPVTVPITTPSAYPSTCSNSTQHVPTTNHSNNPSTAPNEGPPSTHRRRFRSARKHQSDCGPGAGSCRVSQARSGRHGGGGHEDGIGIEGEGVREAVWRVLWDAVLARTSGFGSDVGPYIGSFNKEDIIILCGKIPVSACGNRVAIWSMTWCCKRPV